MRDSAKQNRGNPPIKNNTELQGGLPREQSSLAMTDFDGLPRASARNDDSFLDSAIRRIWQGF